MKILITLTPWEGRRLIAKAIVTMPVFAKAFEKGRIFLAGGITNAYILEEITGEKVDKACYTAGVVTHGVHCVTPLEKRITPKYFKEGREAEGEFPAILDDFNSNDVVIKGGNAIDVRGDVGIMMANPKGGTIGFALGPIIAKGVHLLLPIGLEKLIPSVRIASDVAGIDKIDCSYGYRVGIMPVSYGEPITEIEAFKILSSVNGYHISSGGAGKMQGAITLLLEGGQTEMERALSLIDEIRGEPPVKGIKKACSSCEEICRNKIGDKKE